MIIGAIMGAVLGLYIASQIEDASILITLLVTLGGAAIFGAIGLGISSRFGS